MVTCCIRYRVDRKRLAEFEECGRIWIRLIGRFGGTHHGYFLPGEGRSDEAMALFSFASLSDYERYRDEAASDAEALGAVRFGEDRGLLLDWDRTFYRPVLP